MYVLYIMDQTFGGMCVWWGIKHGVLYLLVRSPAFGVDILMGDLNILFPQLLTNNILS